MNVIRSFARSGALVPAALLTAVLALGAAHPASAVENPHAKGTNWLSVRAGYSKIAAENAPNGLLGYGFGYSRMVGSWWVFSNMSLGGYAHHEARGQFQQALVLDTPFSLELVRHSSWSTNFHPYVGVGYGAYLLKGYRVPGAPGDVRGGVYVVTGGNIPLNANSMIGVDVTGGRVADLDKQVRWGAKLNYSLIY